MKKIFSTVAMAIVAFTAVVSMSSCQNDSPSSFNAAPQVPAVTTTTTQSTNSTVNPLTGTTDRDFSYQATIPSDILTYFDVHIERKSGDDYKTLDFTTPTKYDKYEAMTTVKDAFQYSYNDVTFKAIVTPKANWKELAKENNLQKIVVGAKVNYTFKGDLRDYEVLPSTFVVSDDDSMQTIADQLADILTVHDMNRSTHTTQM